MRWPKYWSFSFSISLHLSSDSPLQMQEEVQWHLQSLVLIPVPVRKRAVPSPFRRITENQSLLPTSEPVPSEKAITAIKS